MSQPPVPTAKSSRALLVLVLGGVAFGAVMALLTIVWSAGGPFAVRSAEQPGLVSERASTDQQAPDFEAETPDGETLRLSDFRGSPVALNFWATWCVPCRAEMPELDSAAQRHKDVGLVILGVNAGEDAAQVRSYVTDLGLSFTTVLDPNGRLVDSYEIRAFPTTIWIDANGMIRARHLGALTRDYIDRYVSDLVEP